MSNSDLVANHYTLRPQTSSGQREPERRVTESVGSLPVQGEFEPLETNNWLLHLKYVRGEHDICKQLADEELVKSRGYNEYANYIMGLILRVEGRIQESLEFFNKCCQLNPRNVENIKQVARSLFLLGRPQQAVDKYTEALKLTSPDWNTFHNLGLCYTQLGRYDEAEQTLIRAVELGRTEESHQALARFYARMADPARAVVAYKTVSALYPSNPETTVELGQLYFETGEFERAFDAWGTALGHDPANPRALLALGAEFQRYNEFEIALVKYKLCAQSLPESAFLWNNIGMCFFSKKKYVAAISCLKRAIYLSPLDWKALYNLGKIFLAGKEDRDGNLRNIYTHEISRQCIDLPICLYAGLVHMHTHQFVSAFHFTSASVKRNPLHAGTFLLLGLSLHSLADDAGARKAFEQSLRLSPDSAELRANFAVFLKHLGEEDAACEQVEFFRRSAGARCDPQLDELLRVTFNVASTQQSDNEDHEIEEDEV